MTMPNICNYSMRVVGKRINIKEFIKIMKADYDYYSMTFSHNCHFFRVFEADADEIEDYCDGRSAVTINGDCAWSVYTCMFNNGPRSYYQELKRSYPNDFHGTLLPIESKRLNLDIEIFSEEGGCAFQEHYIVKQGEILCDDCVDWIKYDVEPYKSKNEAAKDLEVEFTDEEWNNNDGTICRGGFEWDFSI